MYVHHEGMQQAQIANAWDGSDAALQLSPRPQQPLAEPAQSFSGLRALRFLGFGGQFKTTGEFPRRDGRSSRFPQPPCFRRQKHRPPQVRSAP
jgi:hypothetical protein